MKTLSRETALILAAGKFEGRDIAFTPHAMSTVAPKLYGLSIVAKDEEGHWPLPHSIAHGTEEQMVRNADDLNDKAMRLTREQAISYVCSSMIGAGDGRRTA